MRKKYTSFLTKVPQDIQGAFYYAVTKENLNRLLPIYITIYFIEWIAWIFSEHLFNTGTIILTYQLFNTIMLPLLIITKKKILTSAVWFKNVILYSIALATIAFGIALVMSTIQQADLVHIYLLCALAVAAFIIMHPLASFFLYLSTLIVFLTLLPHFESDSSMLFTTYLNTSIFIYMVWFLSRKMFQFKLKHFIANLELSNKNSMLEEMVQHDMMTGLLNHKTILDKLSSEIARSNRYKTPLSILLFDIDNFKQVNDQFGHQVGDQVLITLAQIMKSETRETDFTGRYGGEEFLVIMPSTDIKTSHSFSNRLKEALVELRTPDGKSITISGGLCEFNDETAESLIHRADLLLYKAKRSGKDRILS